MNKRMLMRKLKGDQTMSPSIFWAEFAYKVIGWLCTVIVLAMILSATLPVSTEQLARIMEYVALGMAVLCCIPIARNTRRRLRDAGYSAKAYLWLLLPLVGWIIFVVFMFAKSKPKTNESKI